MRRSLLLLVFAGACQAQEVTFEGLGFLWDVIERSEGLDVSSDGSVVVGWSYVLRLEDGPGKCYDGPDGCSVNQARRGFRWVDGLGMSHLNGLPGEVFCCEHEPYASEALGVSPDGLTTGGIAYSPTSPSVAALWNENGSLQSLGDLDVSGPRIRAVADGGIAAAGYAYINGLNKPIISLGGPVENLIPSLPNAQGEIRAMSNDAERLIGSLDLGDGTFGSALWTYDNGGYTWEWIGTTNATNAYDITADGQVIIGNEWNGEATVPFRWVVGGEFEYLDLPDGATWCKPASVSDDGAVIVGEVNLWDGPAIWTKPLGWRELEQVIDDAGALPQGWILLGDTVSISGDGTTVVGTAEDPQGRFQAYRAVISRPNVYLLAIGIDDNGLGQGGVISPLNGDLSANWVVDSFLELGVPMSTTVLALTWENNVDNGADNILAINAAIDQVEGEVQPGDTFIFYINTHGSFETPIGGDEYELCMQVNPFNDGACENYDTDEYLVVGGQGDAYFDDDLRAQFDSDAWDQVQKLFIVDACFSGGFWSQGPPIFGDSGDFATLPRSAFISSSPEQAFSYSEIITGISYLAYGIEEALENLADDPAITFTELQAAIEDAEGYILDSFSGDNGFTGMIMGGQDFSQYYGEEVQAAYEPMFAETADSAFMLGEEDACAADVNGDGSLNILDFVAFQGLFVNQDPVADCDGNGQFNILDFVCFQGLFQAGCN